MAFFSLYRLWRQRWLGHFFKFKQKKNLQGSRHLGQMALIGLMKLFFFGAYKLGGCSGCAWWPHLWLLLHKEHSNLCLDWIFAFNCNSILRILNSVLMLTPTIPLISSLVLALEDTFGNPGFQDGILDNEVQKIEVALSISPVSICH